MSADSHISVIVINNSLHVCVLLINAKYKVLPNRNTLYLPNTSLALHVQTTAGISVSAVPPHHATATPPTVHEASNTPDVSNRHRNIQWMNIRSQ